MRTVLAGIILVKHKHCHSSLSQSPSHPDSPDWFVIRVVAGRPVAHDQYALVTKRDSEVIRKPVILPIAVDSTRQPQLSMERQRTIRVTGVHSIRARIVIGKY
jgi:hypothetical protein